MSQQLSASLLRLKLLDALRAGDEAKISSVIKELDSVDSVVDTTELVRLRETVLHYAVQVAPLSTIQDLVNDTTYQFDVNAQDTDGNTPLHLAAAASRFNVVKYLLSLPDINDTVVNADNQQPVELAKDPNIAQLMQFERAKFVEKSATQLRQFFSARDFESLEQLLVLNPRAAELLDINGADPESGNTVLHEFIGKEDFEMCDWILKHGGDPFKRDKRGKLPIDLVSRNDPIRKLLKHASKDSNIMDSVVNSSNPMKTGSAPTYKGYLRKWTNFASGYKLRYFVLDQFGILSYYADQGDTNNACRGSLNLGFATLHLDSSEKLKFEIIGKNGIKWHLKANHPVETNRWVWTLQNAITISKDNLRQKRRGNSEGTTANESTANRESVDDGARSSLDESGVQAGEDEKKKRLLHLPRRNKHKKSSSQVSLNSFTGSDYDEQSSVTASDQKSAVASPNLGQIKENKPAEPKKSLDGAQSIVTKEDFDYDLDHDSEDSESLSVINGVSDPTLEDATKLSRDSMLATKRSLLIEISSLLDLFKAIGDKIDTEPYNVGLKTLSNVHSLIEQYDQLVQGRESKLLKRIERQDEINKLWESSIRQLETEIQKREQTLAQFEGKKYRIRKLLESRGISSPQVSNELANGFFGANPPNVASNENTKEPEGATHREDSALLEEIFHDSDDEFFDADEFEGHSDREVTIGDSEAQTRGADISETPSSGAIAGTGTLASGAGTTSSQPASHLSTTNAQEPESQGQIAHEAGNVQEKSTDAPSQPEPEVAKDREVANDAQERVLSALMEEGSFLGYEKPPRSKLAYDEDNRPKVGLWGILKSMIGKDMTKMTLPVSFNECTSLLQRLAEDIEYNDLLQKAAAIDDSTLRMVYVAAFAASEYASTINRIAKPFNPLLGETFEYARPDQNFRLVTEQVSHHPPISACTAQSPKWDYYGENAVDSQFKGRSFDFKHLGKMFCVVRPDNGVTNQKGEKVEEELYSWKKVNTSVVGIIIGNPTVDNYGKMEVTNHTTGDVIVVEMKQRGWKASSAYQLSGYVHDRKGNTHWAIGGHWNLRIFARKVSEVSDKGRRDSLIDSQEDKSGGDPYSGSKFLVWQAAPRPKVPFNLTSFALTLNDLPDSLKPWLPPTDTRLRPDQRAMEDGRYDEASNEKHRVEEKQRAARRKREATRTSYKPNWFVKAQHPITGDSYWQFNEKYWRMRKDKNLEGTGDIF